MDLFNQRRRLGASEVDEGVSGGSSVLTHSWWSASPRGAAAQAPCGGMHDAVYEA
jgi:hypothetical protein